MPEELRILIVEDEILSRETLRILLTRHFGDVLKVVAAVGTADEAREAVKKFRPDAVFLDIDLPHEDGFEFLRSLERVDFAVIFVTANEHHAFSALKLHPLDYILKPVMLTELKTVIDKLLHQTGRDDLI